MPGKSPTAEQQCTATSKRTGERCAAWAMRGKEVCYHHGGKSPVGAGSPHFRDGARSKAGAIFTGDALEHYEVARTDDRYLELREDLAVLDTLLVEALKHARVGEGGALWKDLRRAWAHFRAVPASDVDGTRAAAHTEVNRLIKDGVERYKAQEHALGILERKRRTTETERRRILDQERTITQVQAMSFVAAMVALIREAVAGEETEREILGRFHAGVARLVQQYVSH
jgi:hypothetical protein